MSEPQDTRDVASAYWGQGAPKQTDIHNLGPPPRAVTIAMEEYVRTKHKTGPWVWLVFAGLFFALPPAFVMGKSWLEPLVVVAVAIAVIVYVRRVVAKKRQTLRWFLEHAHLSNATIKKVDAVVVRRTKAPLVRAAVGDAGRYTLWLAVDGLAAPVRCVTTDVGLGNLIEPGQRIEVLLHPDMPNLVITTAELPSA
jgi:hypothetical protein